MILTINKHFSPLRVSVAPMLDWTDRHCRYLLRLISKHSLLYTEMITTGALLHGDFHHHLSFDPFEKPVALQLGGADPKALAKCASLGEAYGYDEINLNAGCPSARVKEGRFGACLMAEPDLVGECIQSIKETVNIPVSVKTRIGIDHQDSYEFLHAFVDKILKAGCQHVIIHARKAWLNGLSPKQNREIPPLRYDIAARLVNDFPQLNIVVNGGIQTLGDVKQKLEDFSGIMLGRAVMKNPYFLAEIDREIYENKARPLSQVEVIQSYVRYVAIQLSQGVPLGILVRPTLGLFQGFSGAKRFRRHLSENAHKPGQNENIFIEAMRSSGFIKV